MPEYSGELTHVELSSVPLWLIVLLPFIGAAINALFCSNARWPVFGRKLRFIGAAINALFGRKLQASGLLGRLRERLHIGSPAVSAVAVGATVISFGLTVAAVVQLIGLPPGARYLHTHAWQMVRIGSLDVSFAFAMDPLGAVMTLIVTGVGALIHLYATAYMAKEPAYWRFFTYMNLFLFSMLLLVLGDNFVVMFFGWEGVGLCSYLLIGFWYKDYAKASAGVKAFVVNRVGDFGFVCGMALLFWGLGGSWSKDSTYSADPWGPETQAAWPEGDRAAYGARFIAVRQEARAEHGGSEHGGSEHGGSEHGAPAGVADGPGAQAHAAGPHATPPSAAAAGSHHGGSGHAAPGGAKPDLGAIAARAEATGLLTMVSHAGARVYFESPDRIRRLLEAGAPDCRDLPSWSAAKGAQLRNDCYVTTPFLRKRIAATVQHVVVIPGDGAVVTGDGDEMGWLQPRIEAGEETVIVPVGSTLTFREIEDQLVVRDGRGATVFRDALGSKTAWGIALLTLACLCFFVGATGKSAQIPLYVWLPDAMAGPTPVSALIHAATMVTAGVYLVARLGFLFSLSPTACGLVALCGAATALFAATMGFFQYDIKKVLAYSTVSQLGFMFIGVGVGAYWVGIFHLMTHAFFKACLFLGSGSVIHGMHHVVHDEAGSQDMRNMGGLRRVMPKTAWTYKVACMAITAVPPGLAGFWSKDEILWKSFNTLHTGIVPGSVVYSIGLVAALGTSFYMWRSYYLTFEGPHAREPIATMVEESPPTMTLVLQALAVLSIVAGVCFGISSHFTAGVGASLLPHEPVLEQWLGPTMAHAEARIGDAGYGWMYGLMAASVLGAVGMWALARKRYGAERPKDWEAREQGLPLFALLHHKYYVDEIYRATIIAVFLKTRLVLAEMDRWIVDGLVNAAGVAGRIGAWVVGVVDRYVVDGLVNLVADTTLAVGSRLRAVQTGRVQSYIYGVLGGVVCIALLRYLLG